MQPDNTPEAGLTRSPLSTPTIAETQRQELASQLESYLHPVSEYCDRSEADDNQSLTDFTHTHQLREFIAAVGRYDLATEQLLTHYREALAYAQQQATQQVPSLERAILCQLNPADLLAHREADPVYRLGYVRGYHKAQQHYERVVSLYAQYAILVPPPGYTHSPLVARVNAHLHSPAGQARAAQPVDQRQALAAITANDLSPNAQS
ncbi:MAG: hypothetical protein ACRYFZ_28170 [Janthinobacterium lividum]